MYVNTEIQVVLSNCCGESVSRPGHAGPWFCNNCGKSQGELCGATHEKHVCTLAPHRPEIDHTEVARTASGFPHTVAFWKSA